MAMKNKMKFWRKMAKKLPDGTRTGRMLRNMMGGTNHPGMVSPIHVWLFRAAGIPMPVYEEQQKKRQEAAAKYSENLRVGLAAVSDNESDVTDLPFIEGTV